MNSGFIVYGIILVAVFLGIIIYLYNPKRKQKIEAPKYRIIDDNDAQHGTDPKD